ncbi:ATP-binding protein [Leptotrichia trevisanii]
MVKNKVQKLQNRQEQKKSTDSNNKLNDDKLREAMEASRELREQELKQKIKYFLKISNLPANWWEKTFEKSDVLSEEENEIKYRLEYYCRHFKEAKSKGLGLYLCGEVGTGKSFYSLCIFNELLKNDYKVYRTTLNGIYQRIQSTFNNFNNLTEEKVFKDLLEADLIILDDLGKENISETWGKSKLYTIFNFFYEKEKSIIISTNLEKEEIADFMDTQGNDALIDRFRERLDTLEFVWDSRRREIGKKLFEEFWNKG